MRNFLGFVLAYRPIGNTESMSKLGGLLHA
jgi:hypothetical protein